MAQSASQSNPHWLHRPLPVGATSDDTLEQRIDKLAAKLPGSLLEILQALNHVRFYREYDSAANLASSHVWRNFDELVARQPARLLQFAQGHMTERAKARVVRRLAKHADAHIRRSVEGMIQKDVIHEVALPGSRDGDWNPGGWLRGSAAGRLLRKRTGRRVQQRHNLPPLESIGDIRELLDIRSTRQLGYLLLATDAGEGPYTKFTIPKRDTGQREICAPKSQLLWVQRRILRKILERVPVHAAAHGFVPGRSTVTNAAAHQGAAIVLKFDLSDFFPTIHYNRVVGLFAGLGYHIDDGRFGNDDASQRVAPTLARLCTYTQDPSVFGSGFVPQGAPSSPAISNLICRGLDGRLAGLAAASGGAYSRYADDLTFSFRDDQLRVGRFRWWVDQICHQEGFIVNQRKFRVIRRSQRQTVTGIVVNDALRVPRWQRRRFRAMLHNCKVHGIESQERGNPSFRSYLRGFASYIHMVHPAEGARLLDEINELLGPEP